MHYLLTLTYRPGEGPQEGTPEFDAEMERLGRAQRGAAPAGVRSRASGLQVDATTTVRKTGGEVVVTDGPYAETKEILFSFYILDVADLDAAIARGRRGCPPPSTARSRSARWWSYEFA